MTQSSVLDNKIIKDKTKKEVDVSSNLWYDTIRNLG
jgi:hypothetical protein